MLVSGKDQFTINIIFEGEGGDRKGEGKDKF